jgi:Protoglobin
MTASGFRGNSICDERIVSTAQCTGGSWSVPFGVGLRHTQAKKNRTDNAQTPPHIPLRYVLVFTATMNATVRSFLAKKGHSPDEVDRMHEAWCKAVILQVTLWSRPYAKEGDW